jgi:hypothetical protein
MSWEEGGTRLIDGTKGRIEIEKKKRKREEREYL